MALNWIVFGGTGVSPVETQAKACGYNKPRFKSNYTYRSPVLLSVWSINDGDGSNLIIYLGL